MTKTLAAVAKAFEIARSMGCERIEAGVTMAARIATNTSDFLDRAAGQGTPIRVLSGEEEANLGFLAVASDPAFAEAERLSIIDVGGHSTELVTADREPRPWMASRTADLWVERYRRSYPIGTLALRGGTLSAESPDGLALLRASKEIDDLIGLEYLPHQGGTAVVLGATGTNLITIRERMTEWDADRVHGQWLDYEEVSKAVGWLSSLTDEERAAVPGMEKGRERTIHLGALILERFLYSLHVLGCRVSVRGWRHALLERM
jgi:exopolyphosphatase/guanosine-5'-triphosphate,3'-diphosphate pyrophosphatase